MKIFREINLPIYFFNVCVAMFSNRSLYRALQYKPNILSIDRYTL